LRPGSQSRYHSNMIHETAKIFPWAKIAGDTNRLSVGALSQIDDFVFLFVGGGCHIGRNVHIASFCSIIGGGELIMEDFSGLSAGCRIVTGSDDFSGPWMTNPTVDPEFTNVQRGRVHIGRHAVLGTDVVVFPNVNIGEGAAVGAGAVIRKDLEPWGIYAGQNPKRIGQRDREAILAKEKEYLAKTLRSGN
jgi:acetyltransferase-like isoleucine patch superfamily enzyme